MNVPTAGKSLLVIDDAKGFCERVSDEAEASGWQVLASSDLAAISTWLDSHAPDVVLLDWQLPGQTRNDFVALLTEQKLTDRTLLLSNAYSPERQAFVGQHSLAGLRLKPLDMEHFEAAIALPARGSKAAPQMFDDQAMLAVINALPLAANILDNDLTPLWSNAKADKKGLSSEHLYVVKWLRAELGEDKTAVRRLDWDSASDCFMESRLYRLNGTGFWLARDWREREDQQPHDSALLGLQGKNRNAWLKDVSKLLAQRYGISRLRVYKIASLPTTEGLEEACPSLVVPLFQSGGGINPSEPAWFNTGYLTSKNPDVTAAIASGYRPEPHITSDTDAFDDTGGKRVLYPVRDSKDRVVALLAFDRRLDHLRETSPDEDKTIVKLAQRMAGDVAFDKQQLGWMKGLLDDIGRRLNDWLEHSQSRRSQEWHHAISIALRDIFVESRPALEMPYDALSSLCYRLRARWNHPGTEGLPSIAGHILGNTTYSNNMLPAIASWQVVHIRRSQYWHAVAGDGEVHCACNRLGDIPLQHQNLLNASRGEPGQAVVIQDFRTWQPNLEASGNVAEGVCVGCSSQVCRTMGSWLAVPIALNKQVAALMVVHSPHAYYFTALRVELMETAAKRILPLLAAAIREEQRSSVLAVSVMHEVKNEAHTALMSLTPQGPDGPTATLLDTETLRFHLENLQTIGQDALDVFRLGLHSKSEGTPDGVESELTLTPKQLLTSQLHGWSLFYDDKAITLHCEEPWAEQKLRISRPVSLKRALRALLHNAFRHGEASVSINVNVDVKENANVGDQARLVITIANPADRRIAEVLCQKSGAAGRPAPSISSHLGLAISRQLSSDAGGSLSAFAATAIAGRDDWVEVAITLSWPVVCLKSLPENIVYSAEVTPP